MTSSHFTSRRAIARASAVLTAITLTASMLPSMVHAAPAPTNLPAQVGTDLVEGSIGPRVTKLQLALIDHGVFLFGGADGVFGPSTTTAIGQFQQWNGLQRTGTVNVATLRRLGLTSDSGDSSTGSSGSGNSNSAYGDLAVGSVGPAVAELQRALLDKGLVIQGGDDGVFGLATRRALMAFQRVNAMTETGQMSDRAAELLRLGDQTRSSTVSTSTSTGTGNSWSYLEQFPVQGNCAYGDTWHAARGNGRVHLGVDIIASTGKLLYAVADGTITTQYWDYPGRLSGNGLKLTAADGTYFLYLHLSGFAPGITRGTEVKAGDVIGFVGNTGSSATSHLHFEIHPGGGAAINPYPYVRAIDACSDTRARYQSSFD